MRFLRKYLSLNLKNRQGNVPFNIGRKAGYCAGFTLVELLVAISILAILVVILGQILGLVSLSWSVGKQRMDNLTKARAFLDLFARDVQDGVFRPDLAAFIDQAGNVCSSSSTSYAFYTKRTGGGTGVSRGLSLVNYELNLNTVTGDSALMRGALPVTWTSTWPSFGSTGALPELATNLKPSNPSFSTTSPYYTEVAAGVIAFRVYFINSNPANPSAATYSWTYIPWNYSTAGTVPVTVAVGVAVVIVDDQTQQVLATQNLLSNLTANSTFTSTPPLTGSLKDYWDTKINTPGFFTGYPRQLRTGLKTFERVVQLPVFTQ